MTKYTRGALRFVHPFTSWWRRWKMDVLRSCLWCGAFRRGRKKSKQTRWQSRKIIFNAYECAHTHVSGQTLVVARNSNRNFYCVCSSNLPGERGSPFRRNVGREWPPLVNHLSTSEMRENMQTGTDEATEKVVCALRPFLIISAWKKV